jgi:hypothetical protein
MSIREWIILGVITAFVAVAMWAGAELDAIAQEARSLKRLRTSQDIAEGRKKGVPRIPEKSHGTSAKTQNGNKNWWGHRP